MQNFREQFESIREDVLDLYFQDEPIRVLDLNLEHGVTAVQFGTATVLVYGVNSWDWGATEATKMTDKYDLVTVFGTLPLDETKDEFLQACEAVVTDHGRVLVNFDYGTFADSFDTVGEFVRWVHHCGFVVESYKEFWGRGTTRFTLQKDFGQGHCANVKLHITE